MITCVAIDNCGSYLVTGSRDTTCMIWQILQENGFSVSLNQNPVHILYGHTEAVTCVDISIEFDMVLTGSMDGTVNLHTIRSGHYLKTLDLKQPKFVDSKVLNVKFGDERHILVYSSYDDEQEKAHHVIKLFSINGNLLHSENLANPLHDMIVNDQYCVLAFNQTNKQTINVSQKPGETQAHTFVAASKIVFKEIFE